MSIDKLAKIKNEQYYIVPDKFLIEQSGGLSDSFKVSQIGHFPQALSHYCDHAKQQNAIIMYCTAGSGFYNINGGKFQTVTGGQIVALPPYLPHIYGASEDEPWSIFFICCYGKAVDSLFSMVSPYSPIQISDTYGEQMQELFRHCFYLLRMPYQIEEYLYVCRMAESILSIIPCAAKQSLGRLTENGSRGIEQAIAFIKNNIQEPLTLDQIADAACLSPSRLHFLFKQTTGYAPVEYFLRVKMQAAAKDVFFSASSIQDIAAIYGIEDPYYFSRLFKKIMGVSPREYRRNKDGQNLKAMLNSEYAEINHPVPRI